MTPGDIRRLDQVARQGFTYRAEQADSWRSHADEAAGGQRWAGDCDDLASTVLDLLGRAGLPLDRRWRLLVSTTGGPLVDHMVGLARDAAGGWWIVGDTADACYPAARCRHRILQSNRLDDRGDGAAIWREGAPF